MPKKGDSEGKKAAKERKAAKQAEKSGQKATNSAKKSGAISDDEENIEDLIRALSVQDAARVAVTISACAPPSPRVNASVTPLPSDELLIFGGEYFDGQTNTCYNDLYRASAADPATGVRTYASIRSPTTPLPRCSHVAVLLDAAREVLIFGGEFSTASQFYHHGDTWRLNTASGAWSRAESRRAPSPRSGHRAAAWRSGALLFGGFFQTLTSDKWFNDLWFFDARVGSATAGWTEVVLPAGAPAPTARSGHGFVVLPGSDIAVLVGGYSEVTGQTTTIASALATGGKGGKKGGGGGSAGAGSLAAFLSSKARSCVHTDVWVLRLANLASGIFDEQRPASATAALALPAPSWERVRVLGIPPSPRTGFSVVAHRDRVIYFGGVSDADADVRGEAVASVFYNDLFSFDVGRRRWTPLTPVIRADANDGRVRVIPRRVGGGGGDGLSAGDGGGDGDDDRAAAAEEVLEADDAIGAAPRTDDIDDDAFYMIVDGTLVKVSADAEPEAERILRVARETEAAAMVRAGLAAEQQQTADAEAAASAEAATAAAAVARSLAALPTPPGRLRAALWVQGNALHVWGGLREEPAPGRAAKAAKRKSGAPALPAGAIEGDIEVTLDDAWQFDLRSDAHAWALVHAGRWREAVWRGDVESSGSDDDDDDDDAESEDEEDESEGVSDDEDSDAEKKGGKTGRGGGSGGGYNSGGGGGASKGLSRGTQEGGGSAPSADSPARAAARAAAATPEAARARELRASLLREDAASTPTPEEDIKRFFLRTAPAWMRTLLTGFVTRLPSADDYDSGSDVEDVLSDVRRIKAGGVGSLCTETAAAAVAIGGGDVAAQRARASKRAARIHRGERLAGKEIRRRAFVLARLRYEEIWPLLAEILENEAAVREFEEAFKQRAEEIEADLRERRERIARKAAKGKRK